VIDQGEYSERVLRALLAGYRAREGMKPRSRSLSEYEIARRLGVTHYSYAQFEASEERTRLLAALSDLLHRGLVQRVGASGRYDTFIPSDDVGEDVSPPPRALPGLESAPDPTAALLERVTGQLREVIELLRSIDRKLGPD
jgi:hypothetical protein